MTFVDTSSPRRSAYGGAPDDFASFYAVTRDDIYRSAHRTSHDHDLAYEAMQEAYTRMLNLWPTRRLLGYDANLRYTIVIARHWLIDYYRHHRSSPGPVPDRGAVDANFDIVDGADTVRAVRNFLDAEPAVRRDVGYLHFVEDRSYREIATALAISESTVHTHVQRLRKRLQAFLRARGEGDHR